MIKKILMTDTDLIRNILNVLCIDTSNINTIQSIELMAELDQPVFISVHSFVNDKSKLN